MITIKLNGQPRKLMDPISLKNFLVQLRAMNKGDQKSSAAHIIAEINGEVVDKVLWDKTTLKDGDAVELISFVGGGSFAPADEGIAHATNTCSAAPRQ